MSKKERIVYGILTAVQVALIIFAAFMSIDSMRIILAKDLSALALITLLPISLISLGIGIVYSLVMSFIGTIKEYKKFTIWQIIALSINMLILIVLVIMVL